jgi:hypothetical protein
MSRAMAGRRGYGHGVLVHILRQYLRPYVRPMVLVVIFQLIQVIANLYLPGLNADIIDKGISVGGTPTTSCASAR